jgi:Ras association domain-containing protein 2/4
MIHCANSRLRSTKFCFIAINSDYVAASDNDTTISESLSYDTISVASDVNSLSSESAPSSKENSPAHNSNSLPSKLVDVKKIEWDEIDELLQVERKDEDYRSATLPLSLTSSMTDSQISNLEMDSSEYKTLSPDETTSQSSSIYYSQLESSNGKCQDDDDDSATLKPCDFEDFKKQISRDFVNGANDMPSIGDGTLKANQRIDPSRINDSLKLYQDNIMNRSVASEDLACTLCPTASQFQVKSTHSIFKTH